MNTSDISVTLTITGTETFRCPFTEAEKMKTKKNGNNTQMKMMSPETYRNENITRGNATKHKQCVAHMQFQGIA
jgi:hypothetical protein